LVATAGDAVVYYGNRSGALDAVGQAVELVGGATGHQRLVNSGTELQRLQGSPDNPLVGALDGAFQDPATSGHTLGMVAANVADPVAAVQLVSKPTALVSGLNRALAVGDAVRLAAVSPADGLLRASYLQETAATVADAARAGLPDAVAALGPARQEAAAATSAFKQQFGQALTATFGTGRAVDAFKAISGPLLDLVVRDGPAAVGQAFQDFVQAAPAISRTNYLIQAPMPAGDFFHEGARLLRAVADQSAPFLGQTQEAGLLGDVLRRPDLPPGTPRYYTVTNQQSGAIYRLPVEAMQDGVMQPLSVESLAEGLRMIAADTVRLLPDQVVGNMDQLARPVVAGIRRELGSEALQVLDGALGNVKLGLDPADAVAVGILGPGNGSKFELVLTPGEVGFKFVHSMINGEQAGQFAARTFDALGEVTGGLVQAAGLERLTFQVSDSLIERVTDLLEAVPDQRFFRASFPAPAGSGVPRDAVAQLVNQVAHAELTGTVGKFLEPVSNFQFTGAMTNVPTGAQDLVAALTGPADPASLTGMFQEFTVAHRTLIDQAARGGDVLGVTTAVAAALPARVEGAVHRLGSWLGVSAVEDANLVTPALSATESVFKWLDPSIRNVLEGPVASNGLTGSLADSFFPGEPAFATVAARAGEGLTYGYNQVGDHFNVVVRAIGPGTAGITREA
ncbi:MAG: hypothetical protein AB1758_33870, partial [Candidatus Eremiobacterota bacterium]